MEGLWENLLAKGENRSQAPRKTAGSSAGTRASEQGKSVFAPETRTGIKKPIAKNLRIAPRTYILIRITL